MRAAPHRDLQAPLAGKPDRRTHVRSAEAAGDYGRSSVDDSVQHLACVVIVNVRRADHRPIYCASKKIKILLCNAGHQDLLRYKQGKQSARSRRS